jgi:DNA-binding MarR family transcriptional regulator
MAESHSSTDQEDWKNIAQASKELNVNRVKLSRMVKKGRIKSKKNPRDERETLVDLVELRGIFPPI